jgi:hypothetical protein
MEANHMVLPSIVLSIFDSDEDIRSDMAFGKVDMVHHKGVQHSCLSSFPLRFSYYHPIFELVVTVLLPHSQLNIENVRNEFRMADGKADKRQNIWSRIHGHKSEFACIPPCIQCGDDLCFIN